MYGKTDQGNDTGDFDPTSGFEGRRGDADGDRHALRGCPAAESARKACRLVFRSDAEGSPMLPKATAGSGGRTAGRVSLGRHFVGASHLNHSHKLGDDVDRFEFCYERQHVVF
jgi:hypothetical protein